MNTFSIFESFFLISIATTFSLVLLLMYYYRARLTDIENKYDQLFDLVQSLAKEVKINHNNYPKTVIGPDLFPFQNTIIPSENLEDIASFNLNYSDEEEEEEDDYISENSDSLGESQIIADSSNSLPFEKITIPSIVKLTDDIDYKKLPVSKLREIIAEKGIITSNPINKMKKPELIALLE